MDTVEKKGVFLPTLTNTKLHNLTKLFEGGWFDLHHSLKD